MISLTLRLVARPDTREELARRVREQLFAPTRGEEGCLSYRFYQDIEDPNAFSFVEEWRDMEAVNGHFRSEHVAGFLPHLDRLLGAPPELRVHEVSRTHGMEALEVALAEPESPSA